MGKRFTDTGIWGKKWFRALSPEFKLAWSYVRENCNAAGVIEVDEELANFQIGTEVDWEGFLDACGDRIEDIGDGKWWLTGFIEFQYGALSEKCKPHKAVYQLLDKHGLSERVLKGYPKGIDTLQEKEKDQEQEKDNKSKKTNGSKTVAQSPPSVDAVRRYMADRDYPDEAEAFVDHYIPREALPDTLGMLLGFFA